VVLRELMKPGRAGSGGGGEEGGTGVKRG